MFIICVVSLAIFASTDSSSPGITLPNAMMFDVLNHKLILPAVRLFSIKHLLKASSTDNGFFKYIITFDQLIHRIKATTNTI
jgi:hypothetical protein